MKNAFPSIEMIVAPLVEKATLTHVVSRNASSSVFIGSHSAGERTRRKGKMRSRAMVLPTCTGSYSETDQNASRNLNADSPKVTTDYVYCPLQQAMVQVYRIALLAPFDRLFA
jgi:hypothetical protein